MKKVKVGLLPLYIKLYDDSGTDRKPLEEFLQTVANLIEKEGFEVIKGDICRINSEFKSTVKNFEEKGADAIITLHLAYSPSLESIDALKNTKLPIVVLDTTEGYSMSKAYSKGPISFNHGIHGVMDMCNLLVRNKKRFAITAGHIKDGKVIKNACDLVRASLSANSLKGSKTGLFGGSFKGMGDFTVTKKEVKKRFGIDLVSVSDEEMKTAFDGVSENELAEEKKYYAENFNLKADLNDKLVEQSVKSCLAVRKVVKEKGLDAFSVNFLDVNKNNLKTMPFVECCIEMQNGVGYAGEGDALTASFTGAIAKYFKNFSFIEIFCPDWKNNKILISHMGEMNLNVASGKPDLVFTPFTFTDADDCNKTFAEYKEGDAVFCNVFKDENENFKMLVSKIKMIKGDNDEFDNTVRGWFIPPMPIDKFLEKLSENGAIHHSFLVYDVDVSAMKYFAKCLDMETVEL